VGWASGRAPEQMMSGKIILGQGRSGQRTLEQIMLGLEGQAGQVALGRIRSGRVMEG